MTSHRGKGVRESNIIFQFVRSSVSSSHFSNNKSECGDVVIARDRLCNLDLDFVCVEVLRPSQPSGVMSSAVSLPNHTFTGQA